MVSGVPTSISLACARRGADALAHGIRLAPKRAGKRYMQEPWKVTVVEEEVIMTANPVERVLTRAPASRWSVDWSAVWVGALSAVMVALIIALIGVAVGAQRAADVRITRWSDFGLGSLIFAVCGAFLSFVVGGWVAGRMTGFVRAEPTILHGAIAWLLGASLMLAVGAAGATPFG